MLPKNASASDRTAASQNKTLYYYSLLNKGAYADESLRMALLLGEVGGPCELPATLVTTDLLIHFEASNYVGGDWVNIGTGGTMYNATLLGEGGLPVRESSPPSFAFTRYALESGGDYLSWNYMRFLRPDAISDDFTWCAWIKTTETGAGLNHYNLMFIVSTETGDVNNDFGFGLDSDGRLAYGDGSLDGSDITLRSSMAVNTGGWRFVAVTRRKSTGRVVLYVDGVADTMGTCNVGNTLSTAEYVLIASETDYPGYTFGGNIGALLGNTSVLTAEQIAQNFRAQRGAYGV